MGKIAKDNLGYLGTEFQYRLVHAFFEDGAFFRDMEKAIDQNMFTEPSLKTIVGIQKDYCNKYGTVASYEMVAIMLNNKLTDEIDVKYHEETLDKIRKVSYEGVEEIESLAEKFFKQQNWVRVSNEIRKIAALGDLNRFDECQKLIDEANAIGRHDVETTSPFCNLEADLSKENIVTIPTGISKLDDCLSGGIDKGKIGLIMGPTSFGKTSMTTSIAAYDASYKCEANNHEGFKVLQIVFEDPHRDIHRKYVSKLSQIETASLNKSDDIAAEAMEKVINHPDRIMIDNNVRIMRLRSGQYSASDIKKEILKKRNEGFKADVVIIDYFECIAPEHGTRYQKKWDQETETMRQLENDAAELDVVYWIPTQGNRESLGAEVVTMDQGSGSIGKQQVAQVVISIARTLEDIANKKATIAVLKNRSGSAGIKLNNITFNNGTCTISCDNRVDFDKALGFDD